MALPWGFGVSEGAFRPEDRRIGSLALQPERRSPAPIKDADDFVPAWIGWLIWHSMPPDFWVPRIDLHLNLAGDTG
jgi:hypothetical protein